jgi:uracil-DNA glycosylase family 4
VPFVGQAGKLLEQLLSEIGLERSDVFIANVLNAGLPATATRCRRRSTTARTTCSGSSS